MPRYYFQVTNDDEGLGSGVNVNFEADDIWDVLERFQAFLKASEFPFVDEIVAVSHDPENDADDLYYFSDGTACTGRELDEDAVDPTNTDSKDIT